MKDKYEIMWNELRAKIVEMEEEEKLPVKRFVLHCIVEAMHDLEERCSD